MTKEILELLDMKRTYKNIRYQNIYNKPTYYNAYTKEDWIKSCKEMEELIKTRLFLYP